MRVASAVLLGSTRIRLVVVLTKTGMSLVVVLVALVELVSFPVHVYHAN